MVDFWFQIYIIYVLRYFILLPIILMTKEETYELKMFNELKKACLSVWEKYKDRPGDYYQEKVDYVNRHWKDVRNYYVLINMFDTANLRDLYSRLSPECQEYYKHYFSNFFEVCKIMGV